MLKNFSNIAVKFDKMSNKYMGIYRLFVFVFIFRFVRNQIHEHLVAKS